MCLSAGWMKMKILQLSHHLLYFSDYFCLSTSEPGTRTIIWSSDSIHVAALPQTHLDTLLDDSELAVGGLGNGYMEWIGTMMVEWTNVRFRDWPFSLVVWIGQL